ncbi:hypothetical protein HY468_02050 [Candidatus Roizmanbacteria bacterium]|nr:hypothetical protein [Candidatus Roizmanbacteria bacterium]
MSDKDKKLDFDLGFLDEESPKPKQSVKTERPQAESDSASPIKWNWKTISIIAGVILVIIIAQGSFDGSNDTSAPAYTPPNTNRVINPSFEEDAPIIPKVKTNNQICKDTYGSYSYSTGVKNADGGLVCNCQDGYVWNSTQTACIVAPPPPKTNEQICKDMNGPYGIYNSYDNTCGCASGYYYGAVTKKCVNLIESRNQSCEASYPGTSFLKYDQTSGKNICDCKAGYDWNNERTACYTTASFNQSCVNSFGQGAYSTTENGKRVCDCKYGYSWNIERNSCVTTASINQACERDVGRNSYYLGYTKDGKYMCSEPY